MQIGNPIPDLHEISRKFAAFLCKSGIGFTICIKKRDNKLDKEREIGEDKQGGTDDELYQPQSNANGGRDDA